MEPLHDPGMTPGERIAVYRGRRGLTQEQAAHLAGVSVSTWRKWESNEREPNRMATWVTIGRVLGVKNVFLLTGLPLGDLPDQPTEHDSVAPIRTALSAFPKAQDEPVDVDGLHTLVSAGWDWWHRSPDRYARTGPVLPHTLQKLRAAIPAAEPDQLPRVLRTTTAGYLLVRAYTKRLGAHDLAMLCADRAMTTARLAQDPLYMAAAAWNMATVLSTQGHSEPAADLCRDAIRALAAVEGSEGRSALIGNLHLLLAIQYARRGDQRRALDALDVADQLAGQTGETNHFRLVFGPANSAIHRAAVELEMGHPRRALRVAERTDVAEMPSVERRHAHYVDLAVAYCAIRDDTAAVHVMDRAWLESPEESSYHVVYRSLARQLLRRETATTRPVLRPLTDRLGLT